MPVYKHINLIVYSLFSYRKCFFATYKSLFSINIKHLAELNFTNYITKVYFIYYNLKAI